MNNFKCSISDREQTRKDFDKDFLADFFCQLGDIGHNPRRYIGRQCGISSGRVVQIKYDRWLESCHA